MAFSSRCCRRCSCICSLWKRFGGILQCPSEIETVSTLYWISLEVLHAFYFPQPRHPACAASCLLVHTQVTNVAHFTQQTKQSFEISPIRDDIVGSHLDGVLSSLSSLYLNGLTEVHLLSSEQFYHFILPPAQSNLAGVTERRLSTAILHHTLIRSSAV